MTLKDLKEKPECAWCFDAYNSYKCQCSRNTNQNSNQLCQDSSNKFAVGAHTSVAPQQMEPDKVVVELSWESVPTAFINPAYAHLLVDDA